MIFNQLACLLFAVLVLSVNSNAQTKLIAHKSHSGSEENFRIAYEGNFFDMDNSNLGMAIQREVTTASLDTLILVSDTVAVMVTSEYCKRRGSQKPNATTKWRAGRDTVFNHPLFTKKNSISYIKSFLHQHYYFQNPTDSVKFIIVEEEQQQGQQEYQSIPLVGTSGGNDNNGTGNNPVIWLSLIALLSLLAGLAYHFMSKLQKAY